MNDFGLHISPEEYKETLLPYVKSWDEEVRNRGVDPLVWFLFGSVVKLTETEAEDINPVEMFARELLGVRGRQNEFTRESDIDVGLIVPEGHNRDTLQTYDEKSIFRTAKVAGYPMQLTRFEESFLNKKGKNIDQFRAEGGTLGIFGPAFIINL